MEWNIHEVPDQMRKIQRLKKGDTGFICLTFYDY